MSISRTFTHNSHIISTNLKMYFSKTTIIAIAALLAQGFALPLEGSTAPCTTASCCDLQDNTCRTAPGASQADCSKYKYKYLLQIQPSNS